MCKLWVSIVIATIILGFVFLKNRRSRNTSLIHKKNSITETAQNVSNTIKPDMVIQNFSIKEILKNKNESLILNSKEGKVFRKTNKIECNDVSCWLNKEERLVATFKSELSLLDREKKEVFFRGDVTGKIDEFKIIGKDINYDFENQKAITNDCLNYAYPRFKFSAQKSVLNLKEDIIEMDGGITCEILGQ